MEYIAEFNVGGGYGYQICRSDTIEGLVATMEERGRTFSGKEIREIILWAYSELNNKASCYRGHGLTIDRGERPMTEYTSL